MTAKTEKSELQIAREKLQKTQHEYHLLVKKVLPVNATDEEKLAHTAVCQAALAAKREAANEVQRIAMGRKSVNSDQ
jgi:uncharacterized protein YhaN